MKDIFKAKFGGVKTAEDDTIEIVFIADKSYSGVIKQISSDMRKHISSGKDIFSVTVSEYREKRSLEQNKLMWALLEKMAHHMNGNRTAGKGSHLQGYVTAQDCYCDMIESFGTKYEYLLVLPQAERLLTEKFRAVRYIQPTEHKGKTFNIYKCYYGSSTYSSKEMSNLIDGIFDRLAEMGISDSDVYMLKDEWIQYKARV